MLTEIEDRLVKLLQEKITEIPKDNIILDEESTKSPGVAISNLNFEFENMGLFEKVDEGNVELEEWFRSDGVEKSVKLKEKPLQDYVRVECPPGTSLVEKKDFDVNYSEGSIVLKNVPPKGEKGLYVRYLSQAKKTMTVKCLRIKGIYAIDVSHADRVKLDNLAEKVIQTLLMAEEKLSAENIILKPMGGEIFRKEGKNMDMIRLKYSFEKELRVQEIVPTIQEIDIKHKKIEKIDINPKKFLI